MANVIRTVSALVLLGFMIVGSAAIAKGKGSVRGTTSVFNGPQKPRRTYSDRVARQVFIWVLSAWYRERARRDSGILGERQARLVCV